MAVNQIEVHRLTIRPLALWNALCRSQNLKRGKWPEKSDVLCWWCCHPFDTIPAFLPVECDARLQTFVCTGNFCSWNCVKKYAWELQKKGTAPIGAHYIGMLSFLTCHRGSACMTDLHDLGLCECVKSFQSVEAAGMKESLQAFGGTQTIEEYRTGFLQIKHYEWVETHFHRSDDMLNVLKEAKSLPLLHKKSWGFSHLSYPPAPGAVVEYVRILPLSNKVFRENDTLVSFQEGNKPKRKSTSGRAGGNKRVAREEATAPPDVVENQIGQPPVVLQGTARPKPTRAKVQVAHGVSRVETARDPESPVMTNEQLLSVNEEQAYYTRNLRQFGNLVDAMGISISKPQGPKQP